MATAPAVNTETDVSKNYSSDTESETSEEDTTEMMINQTDGTPR